MCVGRLVMLVNLIMFLLCVLVSICLNLGCVLFLVVMVKGVLSCMLFVFRVCSWWMFLKLCMLLVVISGIWLLMLVWWKNLW